MKNRGFTLFIAIVITATLLLISTGIISVAVKEAFLTTASKNSQEAFYAADTGVECVLYWDLKNPGGGGQSAFSSSGTTNITCDNQTFPVGGASESTFTITFAPDKDCAEIDVVKSGVAPKTTVKSYGYNDCDPTNPRRVQRAIQVIY